MSYLVLVNSKSGAARDRGPSRLKSELEAAFVENNETADVRLVHPRDIEQVIKVSLRAQSRGQSIIVGGGDGTLSTAANLLAGTDVHLGVLPLGTMNLMARAIGIPLDPALAVQSLVTATPMQIDLLNVGGRNVLLHASIGLQPKVIRIRESLPYRTRFVRLLNGVIAWMRATRKLRRLRISGTMDNTRFERMASAMLISNNVLPEGLGETPVAHDLSGGRVAIYVATSNRRSELVKLALATSLGVWRQSDLVEEFVTTELEIDADRESLLVSADGELVTFDTPLKITIVPHALSILKPNTVTN